jgi:hypothetical protein
VLDSFFFALGARVMCVAQCGRLFGMAHSAFSVWRGRFTPMSWVRAEAVWNSMYSYR